MKHIYRFLMLPALWVFLSLPGAAQPPAPAPSTPRAMRPPRTPAPPARMDVDLPSTPEPALAPEPPEPPDFAIAAADLRGRLGLLATTPEPPEPPEPPDFALGAADLQGRLGLLAMTPMPPLPASELLLAFQDTPAPVARPARLAIARAGERSSDDRNYRRG